jgi:catechol 2,3-dioxygenase-like lactoylglutathione lyase family enzyme
MTKPSAIPRPIPRLTVITLGVDDIRASIAFYEALGFARRLRATGETVAFFDTGGTVLGLYPWDQLAHDAVLGEYPRPQAFRGMTLAWNCRSTEEVNEVVEFAVAHGARLQSRAQNRLWRLFGIFCRSGRSSLGGRGGSGHRGRRRPARAFA